MNMEEFERLPIWGAVTAVVNGIASGSTGDVQLLDESDITPGTDEAQISTASLMADGQPNCTGEYGMGGCDITRSSSDSVAQDLCAQEDELRALGISVVDQLTLERDVEAAVDKAVAQHTRKQRFQILRKEVKEIQMAIKQGDNKLRELKNRLAGMRQRVVDPRYYMSVEAEVRSKAQEVTTLRARQTYLEQKLSAAEENQEELDDYDLEEGEIQDDDNEDEENQRKELMSGSERERLIREGQMTPFGTAMTPASSKTVSTLPKPGLAHPLPRQGDRGNSTRPVQKGPTKAEMISSGEMTPFGTIVKSATSDPKLPKQSAGAQSGGMTDFEKYLQDQINRQKQHADLGKGSKGKKSSGNPTYGIPKKRKGKIKEYKGVFDENEIDDDTSLSSIKKKVKKNYKSKLSSSQTKHESEVKSKRGNPLKRHILHPKKRRVKKTLGTITSNLEADLYKETPRRILSERVSLEESEPEDFGDGSGSEYIPSGQESWEGEEAEDDSGNESAGEPRNRNSCTEKLDKVKPRRKRKKKSEDEGLDDSPPLIRKQKSEKYKDDGNLNDYVKRIEAWKKSRLQKKQEKILQGEDLDSEEEEEEGYEEFEGGYKVPLTIWNKLYKYQRTCVRWLWELHGQGCGGILGDEMGLGKTIQIISFLVGLSYSRLRSRWRQWRGLGPVLIVCPATVIHQWVKEFQKWWPPFRVAVLHESGNFTGTRPALISNINRHCGILVTSYTGVRDQLEILLQYDWHYIILDEGHKIRNPEAQITVAVKRFQTPHRLILSGSPIQNSLKELWSLFDFVFPGKLGTLPVFLQQFAVPITQGGYANASKLEVQTAFKCASMLRDTINPYLLRRMKNDVRNHLNLPDKNEQVLFCGLTEEQRKIYQEYISGDQVNSILGGRMKVFVGLINLRKICNHPDLFTGGPRSFDDNWNSQLQPELRYGWWKRSGKMHVLQSVLRLWSRQGHRVLLFTQSRQMMCILERFLMDEQHTYLKMDGVTSVSSRQPLIEKFNKDTSYFIFLLTTRVGGLGVNLTGADRVVIFDPDWNPSTDSQARERAWRIGQLRHVTIYRLLTAGTIEEKIYHRQIFKQFLTNRVLKDPKQQRFFKTNDLYELFSFTEGEKEKTESSAIFAGTGSEIKLGRKKNNEDEDEEKELDEWADDSEHREKNSLPHSLQKQSNTERKTVKENTKEKIQQNKTNMLKYEKHINLAQPLLQQEQTPKITEKKFVKVVEVGKMCAKKNSEKASEYTAEESKIPLSMSKIERMKELAKQLSQKIGSKNSPLEKPKVDMKENKDGKTQIKIESKDLSDSEKTLDNVTVKTESITKEASGDMSQPEENTNCSIKEEESLQENGSKDVEKDGSPDNGSGMHGNKSELSSSPHDGKYYPNGQLEKISLNDTDSDMRSYKRKRKEKDKHREKHKYKKGKKFEGERIEFLVRKRKYKKTEEEEEAERDSAKSQDEYVLEKLFKKSGVHTALSHDVIINSNDSDYLLMEGEAERVAKEALKAVRASRAWCLKPRPLGSRKPDTQQEEKKPTFGKKKSSIFTDEKKSDESKDKSYKENCHKPMFNGGIDDDDDEDNDNDGIDSGKVGEKYRGFSPHTKKRETSEGSSGVITSSQLLSRMRHRNKGIALDSDDDGEEDYDPDYPSTAVNAASEVEPEVQENIDLLADIRNFVAFQAVVDGRASTQEIIGRFRDRLPPEQTPFFKALLTQICDFHRELSGKGIWSLKGEFR